MTVYYDAAIRSSIRTHRSSLRNRTRSIFSSSGHLDEFLSLGLRRGPTPYVFDLDDNRYHLTKRENSTLSKFGVRKKVSG